MQAATELVIPIPGLNEDNADMLTRQCLVDLLFHGGLDQGVGAVDNNMQEDVSSGAERGKHTWCGVRIELAGCGSSRKSRGRGKAEGEDTEKSTPLSAFNCVLVDMTVDALVDDTGRRDLL